MKKKPFVTIIGNMGSGKTTLAELLVKHLDFTHIEENFGDNVFLPMFFNDMKRWSFHNQTYFLKEKSRQLIKMSKFVGKTALVLEPDILCDVEAYAKAQVFHKNMTKYEYKLYHDIYRMFLPQLPKPDLTIYVRASVPVIINRINKRRRGFEKEIPESYLRLLNRLNDKLARKMKAMVIETDEINIIHNKEDIKGIITSITHQLVYD
jgi:deoxyadenosine/deoxycytidine kinase